MNALIDTTRPFTPPPLDGVKDDFTSQLLAKRAGLKFEVEARYFIDQWTRAARNGMMAMVPIEEVESEFLKGAQLGLSFDPDKMQAFCISHWDEDNGYCRPRFYLGYKGMLHLVQQDKNIVMTNTQLIYENDTFIDKGPNQIPEHQRVINPNQRGLIVGGYAYSILAKSHIAICTIVDTDVMQEIENNARNNGSQAWNSPFINEMRKKTITRRHFNDLLSVLDLNAKLEESNILEPTGFDLEYATHGRN